VQIFFAQIQFLKSYPATRNNCKDTSILQKVL